MELKEDKGEMVIKQRIEQFKRLPAKDKAGWVAASFGAVTGFLLCVSSLVADSEVLMNLGALLLFLTGGGLILWGIVEDKEQKNKGEEG